MKKIFFLIATAIICSTVSQAQFVQGSLTNWPNKVTSPLFRSSANKIVSDGTYYYVATEEQGIQRITRTGLSTAAAWGALNSGLPQQSIYMGTPVYGVMDIEVCGNYLYAICWLSGSSVPGIYRADITSPLPSFTSVSPATPLVSNHAYCIKSVGSYVYISDINVFTTSDIRYSVGNTATVSWSALSLSPGGNIPNGVYSINALVLGTRWDIHFCSHNGLFIQGSNTVGAPTGGQGFVAGLADCPRIEYLYNGSGTFTYAYLSQMYTYSPGHMAPAMIQRIPAGSGTLLPITMTPANTLTSGAGQITSLATWNGNAHFGVEATSGSTTTILYKGDNTANNYLASTFCSGSGNVPATATAGTVCMYSDGTIRLLAGQYSNGVWYTTNAACKDAFTGIDELAPDEIKVYPVPATSELTLQYGSEADTEPAVAIYDMQGRVQNAEAVKTHAGEYKIDVSSLSRGVYTLEFTNGQRITKRIMID